MGESVRTKENRARAAVRDQRTSGVGRSRPRFVREAIRFGAVGGAGVVVNLLVFNILRHASSLAVVRAGVVATLVSITFNYVGLCYFTYRGYDKSGRTREVMLFLLFSAFGLMIENGVLYAATYGVGWDSPLQSNVFKFLGIGVATLFRFWSYRTWVFHARQRPACGGGDPPPEGAPGLNGGPGTESERRQGPAV